MATLDQLHEFRLDLARHQFANAAVLLDIRPLADQIEMIRIGSVATQHAVLDLGPRAVERVVVPVIEFVEQFDKLVTAAGLYPKIINVKVVALRRQWHQCHHCLLLGWVCQSPDARWVRAVIHWAPRRPWTMLRPRHWPSN